MIRGRRLLKELVAARGFRFLHGFHSLLPKVWLLPFSFAHEVVPHSMKLVTFPKVSLLGLTPFWGNNCQLFCQPTPPPPTADFQLRPAVRKGKSMRIHQISLRGVSEALRERVSVNIGSLGPGLIAIVGENGAGKSTLMGSIFAALFR